MYIVLDKSYLQGVSRHEMSELGSNSTILMTNSLLYELVKGTAKERSNWFRKLADSCKFKMSPSLSSLFQYEMNNATPSGKVSSHLAPRDYSMTSKLSDPSFILSVEQKKELEVERSFVNNLMKMSLRNISTYEDVWNDKKKVSDFERIIANDRGYIIDQYKELELLPEAFPSAQKPSSELIDDSWATYRWLQVQNIFDLEMCFKYRKSNIITESNKTLEKHRHDTLDKVYLITALLEGAFAVKEKKLARWFKLLCPNGYLKV